MQMLTRPKELELGPLKVSKLKKSHDGLVVEWFQTQGWIGELQPKLTKEQIASWQKQMPCFVPLKKDEIAIYNGFIFSPSKKGGIVMFGSVQAARAVKKVVRTPNFVTCGPSSFALWEVFASRKES